MRINYADINLVNFFLFFWQLPQCLIGFMIFLLLKTEPIEYTNKQTGMTVLWVPTEWNACWSLGMFVFACNDCDDNTLRHETGHCIQSLFFGPLYLLAVALPSVFLFWWRRVTHKSLDWYFSKYPECWADKLGGVNQDKVLEK